VLLRSDCLGEKLIDLDMNTESFFSFFTPEVIVTFIGADAVDPGVEARLLLEVRQGLKNGNENILGAILRVGSVFN
jgi:hypothetical protein